MPCMYKNGAIRNPVMSTPERPSPAPENHRGVIVNQESDEDSGLASRDLAGERSPVVSEPPLIHDKGICLTSITLLNLCGTRLTPPDSSAYSPFRDSRRLPIAPARSGCSRPRAPAVSTASRLPWDCQGQVPVHGQGKFW